LINFSTAEARLSISDLSMFTLEEELTKMEERLHRLKVEYRVFFNGKRKKPPEDLRRSLEKLAKQLSERSGMTNAQRFRYNTLLTRYYTYGNLWRRSLQDMERGGGGLSKETPAQPDVPSDETSSVVQFKISLSDPKTEQDKVRDLYNALCLIKKEGSNKSTLPYQQFEKYMESRTHNFRNKYGCNRVAYSIALEGGKVRFTAAVENV
jgi:hypothetical protein